MKNTALLILLSIVFLCSSCIVSFENSIADPQSTKIDNRLLGNWKSMDKEKVLLAFTSNSNSETILKLIEDGGESDKIVFSVSSVQIGKYNYLSLKIIDEDNKDKNTFLIAKYEIAGDEMTFWLQDKEKVKKLISQGKLQGSQKEYGEISISNSPNELKKFLESPESDELFELAGKLKKQ